MNSLARSLVPASAVVGLSLFAPLAQVTTSTQTASSGSGSATASASASGSAGGFSSTNQSISVSNQTTFSGGKVFVVEFKQIGSASQQDVNRATATYTVTLNEMQKKGTLILAGQFVEDEAIMVVFRAKDAAEARDMVAKSNMMTSKLFTSFVRELRVTHMGLGSMAPQKPVRGAPIPISDTP